MATHVTVQCNVCRKTFRLGSHLLGRSIQCPHCKTVVTIAPPVSVDEPARPVLSPSRGGLRNRSVAIVWFSVLGVAAVVMIVLLAGGFIPKWVHERNAPAPETAPQETTRVQGFKIQKDNAPTTSAAPATPTEPDKPPYPVEVEGVLMGQVTGNQQVYLCGKAANNTDKPVRAMVIKIPVMNVTQEEIGTAEAIIRDLPPGQSAVFVAACEHDPKVVPGGYRTPDVEIDPPAALKPAARLQCTDAPWVQDDPKSELTPRGFIRQTVLNAGDAAVSTVEVYALLWDGDGKVINAVHQTIPLTDGLAPQTQVELRIPYEYTPKRLIQSAEVWVQAAPAPAAE